MAFQFRQDESRGTSFRILGTRVVANGMNPQPQTERSPPQYKRRSEQRETNRLEKPGGGRLRFALSSTMESVSEVEATAEKYAAEAGLDEDDRFRLTMAVREAAVNAVLHGNDYDPAKQITASFENDGKSLIITIADQGKGLDPDSLPDPLAPENLLRGTGRGIFLIRSFMDEVHFRQLHPGTELTLIKHLAPAAEETQGT
jgi:serine/threonine-protein kinase RsbW